MNTVTIVWPGGLFTRTYGNCVASNDLKIVARVSSRFLASVKAVMT